MLVEQQKAINQCEERMNRRRSGSSRPGNPGRERAALEAELFKRLQEPLRHDGEGSTGTQRDVQAPVHDGVHQRAADDVS